MTAQTPYQPTPPPPVAYPTEPPWAQVAAPAAAEQVAVGQPGWGGVPYTPHGQLMVKYPNALPAAARSAAPAWWPVVLFTVLSGLFGLLPALLGAISAGRRAGRARRSRNSRAPYWIAFGATLAVVTVVWTAVAVAIVVPRAMEAVATMTLSDNLVRDGKIKTPKGTTVRSAACEPTSVRSSSGLRPYTCVVTLSDGRSATKKVVADRNGNWTAQK